MKFDHAVNIVAGSPLVEIITRRYGPDWYRISWLMGTLVEYVRALEHTSDPDRILDEMNDHARKFERGGEDYLS